MSFKEQIMFKDKYPSIFLPQMEGIVFSSLQIFFATNIRSHDRFRPIECWRKYLMDYNQEYSPIFQNCVCCKKYLKNNKHNSLNLTLKICSDICP